MYHYNGVKGNYCIVLPSLYLDLSLQNIAWLYRAMKFQLSMQNIIILKVQLIFSLKVSTLLFAEEDL